MIGAIVGDIVGSRFEWNNIKTKEFSLFTDACRPTDDTNMTLAVAKAILECDGNYETLSEKAAKCMREVGRRYPDCGFGGMFSRWLKSDDMGDYNSFGNGSAMRVSPCGFAANSLPEAIMLSESVTKVTHSHPEGLKGAEAITKAIFMARNGSSKEEIRECISEMYNLNFTLDDIREEYEFDVSCQGSVPQAIVAFLESESFEDAIRNAVSIGGDSDTIAAMTGAVAEAYYGVPGDIREKAESYLDDYQLGILMEFEK